MALISIHLQEKYHHIYMGTQDKYIYKVSTKIIKLAMYMSFLTMFYIY